MSNLLQVAISALKDKFIHKAEALLHGDLHTGEGGAAWGHGLNMGSCK